MVEPTNELIFRTLQQDTLAEHSRLRAIARISYFSKHESSGQCTPSRKGTGWHFRSEVERRIDQFAANPHSDPIKDFGMAAE